jgi:predicted HTH domain antitoxin
MTTQSFSIDLPSDILLTLNEDINELKRDIKLSLAIRLYSLQKITIGQAAQIAELSRLDFETILSNNYILISNISDNDVLEDNAKLM